MRRRKRRAVRPAARRASFAMTNWRRCRSPTSIATRSTPTIEKRDDPSLAAEPVIVGGGRRGVVAACLLYRAHLRHPIGDADVRGAAALSACQSGAAQYGEIFQSRPRSAGDDAGLDAAGRAAVDRRGVPRSCPAPNGCTACGRPRRWRGLPPRSRRRCASRCRSGSPATNSSPRSPPISTSRAALPCSAAARPRRSWRQSR